MPEPGFVSNIENYWEHPELARWLLRVGSFARVIMFDKRGTGLSDPVSEAPSLDLRMDDVRAVMDAVEIERAALLGISEGGHEDDAERAVRAGLELVAAVGGLKTHALLQTRVGIATGLVVVGDLIGSGASQEQTIVGETPNLAARLQGIAEPNSVVIAESTRKLVGELFELQDLGAQDLKGIAGPTKRGGLR